MRLLRMSGRNRTSRHGIWNMNRQRLRRCELADRGENDNQEEAGVEGGVDRDIDSSAESEHHMSQRVANSVG